MTQEQEHFDKSTEGAKIAWFSGSPSAAWFEDPAGQLHMSLNVQLEEERAREMGAEIHYLYEEQKPLGARIGLGTGGQLVLHLSLRDGTPYEVELPEGKAEKVMRLLLESQRARPEAMVGERAGATVFAMKEILAAMGESVTVTRVAGGKKALGLQSNKTLEELGL